MLAFAAAAAIPVILHLWNRRRQHVVDWAAMQFLIAALKKVDTAAVVDHQLELRGMDGALLIRASKADRKASKPATPASAARY